MKILSMTGYGKGEINSNDIKMSVEVKSVNHRFLDLNIKMPRIFNCCEDKIRDSIKSKLQRGHVDVYINYDDQREGKDKLSLDLSLAKSYLDASDKLASTFGIENNLNTVALLNFRDVVTEEENENNAEEMKVLINILMDALNIALDGVVEMREQEGNRLIATIDEYLLNLTNCVNEIEGNSSKVIELQKTKLTQRINDLLGDVQVDQQRLINEIVFMVDKIGIDEEVIRLNSHIKEFKTTISNSQSKGKRLDFIVQEMNREINTIGSKSNNADIANLVINAKTEIEKIREQIQNIE